MKYLVSGDFLTLMQIKNLKNLWMRTCFNSIHTLKHIRYSKNIQNILVVKLKRFKEITHHGAVVNSIIGLVSNIKYIPNYITLGGKCTFDFIVLFFTDNMNYLYNE